MAHVNFNFFSKDEEILLSIVESICNSGNMEDKHFF